MNRDHTVMGLFIGKPKTLNSGMVSCMQGEAIDHLELTTNLILNNEITDLVHHGGDMRVLHHYTQKNYEHLKSVFPQLAEKFTPGSFGENIYTQELTEDELCVGDIFTIGETIVQLTVPRRPCSTINQVYGSHLILKEVINSFHVGWFYKVVKEGRIKTGDILTQTDRPYPKLKLNELMLQGYGRNKFSDLALLQNFLDTNLMDKGWKPKLEKALSSY